MSEENLNTEAVVEEVAPVENTETMEEASAEGEQSLEETLEVMQEEGTPEEKEVAKQMLRKIKLKVDGEEIEEELPFDLPPEAEDYIRKQLQLAKVANKRMQESAELKKVRGQMEDEIKEFVMALRENPESVLSDPKLGIDIDELASRVMNRKIEEESKSPEQKARETMEKELTEARKKLEEIQLQKEQVERAKIEEQMVRELQDGIQEAIETEGLTKDARVIKRFTEAMKAAASMNIELTPQEVAPLIKKQMYEDAKFLINQIKDEELEEMVGKDRLNRFRKRIVPQIKTPINKDIQDTGTKENKSLEELLKKPKKINSADFFRNLSKQVK